VIDGEVLLKKTLIILLALLGCSHISFAATIYEVDKVLDNGYYIINGLEWKPHTSCRTLQQGDKVSFIEGNANGECVSAIIRDHNSNSNCKLWCNDDL